ncbi:hypothetical protein NKG05_17055 [Oerskovia sp. M15]
MAELPRRTLVRRRAHARGRGRGHGSHPARDARHVAELPRAGDARQGPHDARRRLGDGSRSAWGGHHGVRRDRPGRRGWSARERADRLRDFTALLDRLLTEPAVTHDEGHYRAHEARTIPGPVQGRASRSRSRRRDLADCGWPPATARPGSPRATTRSGPTARRPRHALPSARRWRGSRPRAARSAATRRASSASC